MGEGFLTAKHVLGDPQPPFSTTLNDGTSADLIDLPPDCFDAALLEHAIDTTNPMQADSSAAFNQTVEVESNNGSFLTTVESVVDPLGSWAPTGPLKEISLKFMVSDPGQPGDSGALVHDDPHGAGDGLGIYLGKWEDSNHNVSGYCQDLRQLRQIMELELFRI